jgi:hypothetical protein
MRVCIDTNVMLSALAKGSPMQPLFAAIVAGRIELVITIDFMGSFPTQQGCRFRSGAASVQVQARRNPAVAGRKLSPGRKFTNHLPTLPEFLLKCVG